MWFYHRRFVICYDAGVGRIQLCIGLNFFAIECLLYLLFMTGSYFTPAAYCSLSHACRSPSPVPGVLE